MLRAREQCGVCLAVEPSIKMYMARFVSGQNGHGRMCVQFQDLEVHNKTPDMAWLQYPYSVMHFINESSPLAPYVLVPHSLPEVHRDSSFGPKPAASVRPHPTVSFARDHVEVIVIAQATAVSSLGLCCVPHSVYTVWSALTRTYVTLPCARQAATGNGCESRASYSVNSIDFGHRFAYALFHHHDGTLKVEVDHMSTTVPEDPSLPLLLPHCF
jgi:hypothetical protein